MRYFEILLLAVGAAVAYGIVHDLITARICVEYFTIGHRPIFGTDDPTLLGLGWGVFATWWMGVILGVPLAAAARVGTWPKLRARDLVRPIGGLLAVMGMMAFLAGMAGHMAVERGWVRLGGWLATAIPAEKHAAFMTDAFAHLASYGAGFLGGSLLIIWTLIIRRRLRMQAVKDASWGGKA